MPNEIRKFSDEGIQKAIDNALLDLGPEHKGAVVAFADLDKVSLAVVARVGESNNWSVVGILNKPYKGKLDAQAAVRYAW